ncbi:acyl-CoA dehydrogenase family protein [Streptomyces sp. NPDC093595]|uniref:acyl-CoA dehydrogenase family protein n=1 Tax=Streptomyces sp. NPDC093595 TaxID=3366045 RepID=UPI00381C9E62
MNPGEYALERAFGPLSDDGSRTGARGVLAADEARRPWREGWDVLNAWGVGAACVPVGDGGRWSDSSALMRELRPVFRRDLTTGLGVVGGILRPMVAARSTDAEPLRRRVASHLLSGGLCASADEGPATRRTTPVLGGHEGSLLVATRQDAAGRARVLVADAAAPADAVPTGAASRLTPAACRGLDMAAADLTGLRGESADVADDCQDLPYLATGALAAGGAVGSVDTAIRLVLDFALSRRLYGTAVAELPHAAGLLAGAYADVLAAEAVARDAARALDRVLNRAPDRAPHDVARIAVAVHLVPRLLSGALRDLATVLGARFYLREGPQALFGKFHRDIAMLGVLFADRRRCVPWIGATGATGVFETAADWSSAGLTGPAATRLAGFAERRARLASAAPAPAPDGAVSSSYAEEHATLHAAAACLRLWQDGVRTDDGFLGDPSWLAAALPRLDHVHDETRPPVTEDLAESILPEMIARLAHGDPLDASTTSHTPTSLAPTDKDRT